jgi:hypothetical protein
LLILSPPINISIIEELEAKDKLNIEDSSYTDIKKTWTNFIYLNADNDLSGFVAPCLKCIEKIGSSKDVNVLVQYDGPRLNDAKRMLIRKIFKSGLPNNDIYEENIEYDMLNPKTVSDFLEWGLRNFPADKISFSLVTHGAGIFNFPKLNGDSNDQPRNGLTPDKPYDSIWLHMDLDKMVTNIKDVLAESYNGKKIELFIYNACLMGNFESLATLSSIAKYAAASEYPINYKEYDLPKGDTYGISIKSLLKYVTNNPDAEINAICRCLIETFRNTYESHGYHHRESVKTHCPQSSLVFCNLSNFSIVKNNLKRVVKDILLKANKEPEFFKSLFIELLKIHKVDSTIQYIDFGHFAEIIYQISHLKSAEALHNLLCNSNNFILEKVHFHSSSKKQNSGISIFLPTGIIAGQFNTSNPLYRAYKDYKIVKETGWGKFIDIYINYAEQHRVDILTTIVEDLIIHNKIIQFDRPWDDYYSEAYLFLLAEIALYPLLESGDFDRIGKYLKLIAESNYQSPQFNKHRKGIYRHLKRIRENESNPDRCQKIETLLSAFSKIKFNYSH